MAACKVRFSALPVLTYLNVRCAPVLENQPFRLALTFSHSAPAGVSERFDPDQLRVTDDKPIRGDLRKRFTYR